MIELQPDEHAVPIALGERIPMLPFLWPLDWTQRQVYWMAICFWAGSTNARTDQGPVAFYSAVAIYLTLGLAGVLIEYMVRPSPEFWVSAWLEYGALVLLSVPLWAWERIVPRYANEAPDVPFATLPRWLGDHMVGDAELLSDGVLRQRAPLRRSTSYSLVLGIRPRPHPDMLPMLSRQAIIQARLGIFRHIRARWSLHLQVRQFDERALEVASGPAWNWVRRYQWPRMVMRRPSLVLYGKDVDALRKEARAVLKRFEDVSIQAWQQAQVDARRLHAELYSDVGRTNNRRVRIGLRRIAVGKRVYRSWALTLMPQIIHLAWLRPLTGESLLCDLAIHVKVRPHGAARRWLQRCIRRWRAVDTDEDYAHAVDDARRVLTDMRRNRDRHAMIGVYVTARDEQADLVAEALESSQCEFRPALAMQHRALRATRTLGGDPFGRTMKGADLRTVATTDLLATAGYWPDDAILIGEGLSAPEPVGLNPFDDANLNWATFVAIMQGGGKTTFAETLAWRMANPHKGHRLAQIRPQIVTVDFKASGDYAQLYYHLDRVGHHASYNVWKEGPIPPLEGHMGFNLADVPEPERGAKLLELAERITEWAAAHSLDWPLVLILDEILALLEVEGGPSFMRTHGTQGRSMNVSPVFCTQDVEPVLEHPKGKLAFKNCAQVFLGRQNPAGINAMVPLLDLDPDARVLLANAPRGAGLLRIERSDGPVVLGVQVIPTEWELQEFGTNPSERRWRRDRATQVAQNGHSRNGKKVHVNGVVLACSGAAGAAGAAGGRTGS